MKTLDDIALPENERRAIEAAAAALPARVPVSDIVLFGSKARGDASVESDIDILAVVRSEDWKLGDEVRDIGYELEIAHSVVLSIQVMGQRQYQDLKARGSSFLAQVEQEGVAV